MLYGVGTVAVWRVVHSVRMVSFATLSNLLLISFDKSSRYYDFLDNLSPL